MNRKPRSAKFKAQVALEALKNQKTINALATEYQVHPNQIGQWKKQLLEGLPSLSEEMCDKFSDELCEVTVKFSVIIHQPKSRYHVGLDIPLLEIALQPMQEQFSHPSKGHDGLSQHRSLNEDWMMEQYLMPAKVY